MGMESGWWRACVDPVHSLLQIIHKSRNPTLVISTLLAVNDKNNAYCEFGVRNTAKLYHNFVIFSNGKINKLAVIL